jgi:hypothetical protein
MEIQSHDPWSLGHGKNSWLRWNISECSGIWELWQKLWESKPFPQWCVNFNTPLCIFHVLMKLLWLLAQIVQLFIDTSDLQTNFAYIFCYIKFLTQPCWSAFSACVYKKEREITFFLWDNNTNYIKFCRPPTTCSKSVISITVMRHHTALTQDGRGSCRKACTNTLDSTQQNLGYNLCQVVEHLINKYFQNYLHPHHQRM